MPDRAFVSRARRFLTEGPAMAVHMPILAEAANSLAMAVVAASDTPLLLLDDNLSVISASGSFCDAFGVKPTEVSGRQLAELADGSGTFRSCARCCWRRSA